MGPQEQNFFSGRLGPRALTLDLLLTQPGVGVPTLAMAVRAARGGHDLICLAEGFASLFSALCEGMGRGQGGQQGSA